MILRRTVLGTASVFLHGQSIPVDQNPWQKYLGICGNVRYFSHLYCLVVQVGLYSDAVECSTATQEIWFEHRPRQKVIGVYSPVTGYTCMCICLCNLSFIKFF